MFCPKCGNRLPDNAKFCDKCGAPAGNALNGQARPQQPAQSAPQTEPKRLSFVASGLSGEAALGPLGASAYGAAPGAVPSPANVISSGVKSFFSSIGFAFKDPKRLIPAFVLAVVWLVLNILQACGINPIPTRILSFLTFANGGMSGGILGAVGGIIGKGIFAGAVASVVGIIVNKKKFSVADTVKSLFSVSVDSLWAYLAGIGAAMLFYLFISGGATRISFMGGIAAAYLSARAAVTNGFMQRLLYSLFSKGKGKAGPNVQGIVRGLSVGFAAAALIGMIGVNLILIIPGSLLLVGGAVMMILQATGVVKLGKGARIQ